MDEYCDDIQLNRVYAALSDPTRRAILQRLEEKAARVTELAAPFDISLNSVSKHIRVLERAGLVRREVRGRDHHLFLNPAAFREAFEWIETYQKYWDERLDSLVSFLSSGEEDTT